MSESFGDTSYVVALLVPKDMNHLAAHHLASASRSAIVTSEYIVVEVANLLSRRVTRTLFERFALALDGDERVTMIPVSSFLLKRGIELYTARTDKTWSLTDCISFEIMRMQGITDALTADHHFEQAGFNVLLRPVTG